MRRGPPGSNSWLWLEYRQPVDDFESSLGSVNAKVYEGALVHYQAPGLDNGDPGTGNAGRTYLVDFTPVAVGSGMSNAPLTAGSTWQDPHSDLSIAVGAALPSGLNVTISHSGASVPGLKVRSTHAGSFTQGQPNAFYTLSVSNQAGAAPSNGAVTVTDTLPAGLAATALSGDGWTCTPATLTCTRPGGLAAGATYPPIFLAANVASNVASAAMNLANLSGGGSSDDTFIDRTAILAPFTDVGSSDAFLPAIDLMREYGITSGCGSSPPTLLRR